MLIGTGSGTSDRAISPFIIQLSNGKYRIYYAYYSGTYYQLAYKETTDTNLPASAGSNLGAQVLIGTGSGTSDYDYYPFIIQLSSGKYRIYYTYYNGTYSQLAYKETTDASATPSLDDIVVNYTQYATSTDLTSSSYDSGDSANVLSSLQWTENLPSGTDIKFQLRTAADSSGSPGTWTSWLGPDGTSDTYFTDPAGGESMPSAFTSGDNDQWVQYKVFMTSTGANTPTLSDVTVVYIVNAAPEIQAVTASQGSDGNVSINYEIRDVDTNSGTANPGYVTPSFEYYNGSSWSNITNGLSVLATTTKAVNQSTFTQYSVTWNASTTIQDLYTTGAIIRITVNDGEGANNTTNAQSSAFTLDTTSPASTSILVKATTTPAILALSASDDSSLQMKVSLNSDLSGADWESYSTSKTISLSTDPDAVYVRFKDAYGNESATISASSQATPGNVMIQDTSNVNVDPDDLRLFLAWEVVSEPANGFGSYHVYRSTDQASWSLLSSIGTRSVNYYTDSTPTSDTTYYYKIATVDALGNTSYASATSTAVANGTQDGTEGGGGSNSTAPVISSVSSSNTTTQSSVVSWTTDTLSNSVVGYCASPCSDYVTNQTTVASYVTSHSVTLSSLTPNTTYNYKVFSTDASSNTASSSGYTTTTNDGPTISNVSVTNVSNVSADITWNTNEAASGYVFYSTTTPVTSSDDEAGWGTLSTSRTVSLTSLTGGTKYYFFVKSQDSDNNWAYDYNIENGAIAYYTFTTPLDVTAPTISSVSSTTQRTSAAITWQTNESADSRIIYGTTTDYGSTTALDSTLTRTHSVSLSSLASGTTYHYKVISSDASGNQATSSDYTLLTETLSLTGITATTPTNTTATISWTTSDNATSQVEYSTFSDLSSSSFYPESPSNSVTDHSVSLSSLSEGTTYYYRVKSAESGTGTTTSQIYQFTTGDSQAPTVSSVSAISVKDTSAVITWTTDEPASSQIQYGTASGSYTTSTTLDSTLTRTHSVSLTGLSYQTIYYYRVLSSDGNSNATTSSESSFTTLEQQINISQQNVTTIVSGGGGGSGSSGVPLEQVNNLKLEMRAVKAERDDWKKKYDSLQNRVLGMGTSTSDVSPGEIISLVINKFKEVSEIFSETAAVSVRSAEEIKKLKEDIIPAATSLRQLIQLIPPPKLKTEPRVEIKPTEAIVSWQTDEPATSVVYFSEAQDYDINTPDTYTNTAGDTKNFVIDHNITLKGLVPLTEYHYRLMSESQAGAKAYSSDFIFTTKPETPIVSSARAEKSSDTSITVTWRTNIPTNSAVIYTPVIAGKPDISKSKSEGKPDFTREHSITIPRMEPSTIYNLEISSSDHFGNVAMKKLEPMSIAKDETPPDITQVRYEASILTGSSNKVQVIIYWKTDEPSTTQVVFEKGQAAQGKEDEFSGKSVLNEEITLNHISVITSWEPGQVYRFRAVSIDAFGNEAQSKTFTVVAPKQKDTVIDLIIDNFSETFDWTKKIGL